MRGLKVGLGMCLRKSELILTVLGLALLQGCAHNEIVSKALDQKLTNETDVTTRGELKLESSRLLENAQGLTDDERTKLIALRQSTATTLDGLREQSIKLRSLLIKKVLDDQDNSDEVGIIKDKLKDVEDQRLSVFLEGIRKANEIMGRWASRTQRLDLIYFDQMYYFDDPTFF